MQSADAYNGTDDFGDSATATADSDSQDYNITLPRTELGGTDAAANSRIVQPDAGQPGCVLPGPVRDGVTAYTVVQGDTVQSVADKFQVMPETVMGSNGIYDLEQDLTPGPGAEYPAH